MKPSIPKGTRDFGPADTLKRQFIFITIKRNFELFGFQQIETPAMENIGTLTGKYGDEGDQLIFKILNSRIHEHKNKELLKKEFDLSLETARNSEALTERALRYDLTVPFARYVVMHQHEITFPFKRYQIQPVWRADRPQKGRYREFYQCDADVIGSNALLNELELMAMMDKAFAELKVPVLIKLNNRKVLAGIADKIKAPEKIIDITVAIDKFDKIGMEGVNKELKEKGLDDAAIDILKDIFELSGNATEKLQQLRHFLAGSEIGLKGLDELDYLFKAAAGLNQSANSSLELDITLARGLNYYTGTIFEVKANAGTFSPSILGGGRYDDLTGIFGLKGLSGVGISFGIDRIYDVMEELGVFPASITAASATQLLFANFGEKEQAYCLQLAAKLRNSGINCEIYPDPAKMKKQFEYADKKKIPYVCVIGSNEMDSGRYALKNMNSGEQREVSADELIAYLKQQ